MSLVSDVRKIVRKETENIVNGRLPPASEKTPLNGGIGKGVAAIGAENVSSGGLTPPFTETSAANRQYYDEQILSSSDGVFSWSVEPIKVVQLADNEGATVVINYAEKIL